MVGCENVTRASLPGTNFLGDVETNANVDAVVIPLLVSEIRRSIILLAFIIQVEILKYISSDAGTLYIFIFILYFVMFSRPDVW